MSPREPREPGFLDEEASPDRLPRTVESLIETKPWGRASRKPVTADASACAVASADAAPETAPAPQALVRKLRRHRAPPKLEPVVRASSNGEGAVAYYAGARPLAAQRFDTLPDEASVHLAITAPFGPPVGHSLSPVAGPVVRPRANTTFVAMPSSRRPTVILASLAAAVAFVVAGLTGFVRPVVDAMPGATAPAVASPSHVLETPSPVVSVPSKTEVRADSTSTPIAAPVIEVAPRSAAPKRGAVRALSPLRNTHETSIDPTTSWPVDETPPPPSLPILHDTARVL